MRVVGPAEYAGREAVRVAAVNKEGQTPYLGPGADDYELLVDAERGILLRCAARLHGEEFERIEVVEISFDEDLPEDLFPDPKTSPHDAEDDAVTENIPAKPRPPSRRTPGS